MQDANNCEVIFNLHKGKDQNYIYGKYIFVSIKIEIDDLNFLCKGIFIETLKQMI